MTTVVNLADHQPEPAALLRIFIAPGDPTGYPISHPYIDGTGTHAIFVSGECSILGHHG